MCINMNIKTSFVPQKNTTLPQKKLKKAFLREYIAYLLLFGCRGKDVEVMSTTTYLSPMLYFLFPDFYDLDIWQGKDRNICI